VEWLGALNFKEENSAGGNVIERPSSSFERATGHAKESEEEGKRAPGPSTVKGKKNEAKKEKKAVKFQPESMRCASKKKRSLI